MVHCFVFSLLDNTTSHGVSGLDESAVSTGRFGAVNGPKQCTAMSRRTRERCKGPAMLGSPNQKCRMHGGDGSHSIGVADHSFKSGRYSRYLPTQLDQLYREALSNPELIEMGDHIALLEARMQEMLATSSAGDPVPKWSDIAEVFAEVTMVVLGGEHSKVTAALERMQKVIDGGMKWDTTWNQIGGIMEQLRKLTDTEVKRKKELNQMVPVERVVAMMAAVASAVKRNVKDPEQIAAVYRELSVLHGTDTVPGNPSIHRVGPEIIDVTHRRTKKAKRNAIEGQLVGPLAP